MNKAAPETAFRKAVAAVSDKLDADVILFNQAIGEAAATTLHEALEAHPNKRKNVFIILVTLGGDAHAAYIIARELQLQYERVILCIAGDCYSAGTLIVACANEVVIADRGRLGPLDVQLLKRDELRERLSGLTVGIALEELNSKVSDTLFHLVADLKQTFGPQISFRMALDVSANLTAQMYGEVYKQIDPIRLGEDARALQISGHYAKILNEKSANLKPGAIDRLTTFYPSHECIIDRTEAAQELFNTVRAPNPEECEMLAMLGNIATDAGARNVVLVFSQPRPEKESSDGTEDDNQAPEEGSNGRSARAKSGSTKGTRGGDGSAE